jgi:hypothetical protein
MPTDAAPILNGLAVDSEAEGTAATPDDTLDGNAGTVQKYNGRLAGMPNVINASMSQQPTLRHLPQALMLST